MKNQFSLYLQYIKYWQKNKARQLGCPALFRIIRSPCIHVFIQQLSVSKAPITNYKLISSFPISTTARSSLQKPTKTTWPEHLHTTVHPQQFFHLYSFQSIIPDNPAHLPAPHCASTRNIRYFPQPNNIWSAPPHIRGSYLLPHTDSAPPGHP